MGVWTGYRGGPARTAAVPEGVPARDADGAERWGVEVVGAEILQNGIRVANGRVYLARSDGVSVLDAETGAQVWQCSESVPTSGLFVADSAWGEVVIANRNGIRFLESGAVNRRISGSVTVDIESGGGLCQLGSELFAWIDGAPADRNVMSESRKVRVSTLFADAVYAEDPEFEAVPTGPIAADENGLYVGTGNADGSFVDTLSIVDRTTAHRTAARVDVSDGFSTLSLRLPVVPDDGVAYAVENDPATTRIGQDSVLVRYASEDESMSIHRENLGGRFTNVDAPPVIGDELCYHTIGLGDELIAWTPDGSVAWEATLPSVDEFRNHPRLVAIGDVVYAAQKHTLVGYDSTGSLVLERTFSDPIVALAAGDPGLYVGTETSLYALTDVDRTQVFRSTTFCPECGTSLETYADPTFCPECGRRV